MKTLLLNFVSILRRFKAATFLNIAGLAVAFAAFLLIMMQIEYEWNFDRCHPTSDRIVRVDRFRGDDADMFAAILPRAFADVVFASSPHIEAATLIVPPWNDVYITIGEGDNRKGFREYMALCYPNVDQVFGFDLLEGSRGCLSDPEKVMIPQSMARRMFGDTPAVGQQLRLDQPYSMKGLQNLTVGAVYRDFPKNTQLNNYIYSKIDDHMVNDWETMAFFGYMLLDQADSKQAVEDTFNKSFDFVSRGYPKETKMSLLKLTDIYYQPDQLTDYVKSGSRDTVTLLLVVAFLVLVVAGINFLNFSTSLAPLRMKSINTQKVLGSSVGGLRRALVMEAVCFCLLACLLAFGIIYVLNTQHTLSFMEADTVLSNHLPLIGMLLGIAVLVGFIAGMYPAWYMTSFPPALVLKGNFGLSLGGRRLRTALIGFQYIVSIGLIIGAVFVQLQNNHMRSFNLGFEKDQIAIVKLTPQMIKENREVYTTRLKAYPGIEDVAFSSQLFGGSDSYMMVPKWYDGKEFYTYIIPVSWNFLDVMGMPVTGGRNFQESDIRCDSMNIYIYNRSAQERMQMEAGHSITGNGRKGLIAGFTGEARAVSFRRSGEEGDIAFVLNKEPLPVSYIRLKAGTDVEEAVEHISRTLAEIDPAYPFDIQFYDSVFDQLYHKEQYLKKMVSLFGLLAILISIAGVFGLVVFETQYRIKEISVRKVYGASVGEILSMFNRLYLRIVGICFVLAAPIAWYGVHKWLEHFSSRTPVYWWVFALAFAIVAIITLLTVTFQNWRAANTNPAESMKAN